MRMKFSMHMMFIALSIFKLRLNGFIKQSHRRTLSSSDREGHITIFSGCLLFDNELNELETCVTICSGFWTKRFLMSFLLAHRHYFGTSWWTNVEQTNCTSFILYVKNFDHHHAVHNKIGLKCNKAWGVFGWFQLKRNTEWKENESCAAGSICFWLTDQAMFEYRVKARKIIIMVIMIMYWPIWLSLQCVSDCRRLPADPATLSIVGRGSWPWSPQDWRKFKIRFD